MPLTSIPRELPGASAPILSPQTLAKSWGSALALCDSVISVANECTIKIESTHASQAADLYEFFDAFALCESAQNILGNRSQIKLQLASLDRLKDRELNRLLAAKATQIPQERCAAVAALWNVDGGPARRMLVLLAHCSRVELIKPGDENCRRLERLLALVNSPNFRPDDLDFARSGELNPSGQLVQQLITDLQAKAIEQYGSATGFILQAARDCVIPIVHMRSHQLTAYPLLSELTEFMLPRVLDWHAVSEIDERIQLALRQEPADLATALWELHGIIDQVNTKSAHKNQ